MSVVTIIVKTIVKLIYGVVQLIGVLAEGIFKLSTKVNENLVTFDKKMAKEFKEKEQKAAEKVPT